MRHLWPALVLNAVSLPALSQTIDDEIMARVVEPCLIHGAEISGLLNVLPKAEALKALKASNLDQIQAATAGTLQLIDYTSRSSIEARQPLYDIALEECKANNLAERKRTGGYHLREDMKQYEMDCYQDINCWWDTAFKFHVAFMCEDFIQIYTRGEYAWMDFIGDKWSSVTWGDDQKNTVKLRGERLRTPDSTGQYTQRNYTCTYDRKADLVTQVTVH